MLAGSAIKRGQADGTWIWMVPRAQAGMIRFTTDIDQTASPRVSIVLHSRLLQCQKNDI